MDTHITRTTIALVALLAALPAAADNVRIHGSTAAAMAAAGHQFDPGFAGVQLSVAGAHYNDTDAWSVAGALQFPAFGHPLVAISYARAETHIELRGGTVAITWQWSYR